MSNKLYKKKEEEKEKETPIGTIIGRFIYICNLILIVFMLLIAFIIPSNIDDKRVFTCFIIMIILLLFFATYGIVLALLSKRSIKFKEQFEDSIAQLHNLNIPEDADNVTQYVIYRSKFYKILSVAPVITLMSFLILSIRVDSPVSCIFWLAWSIFSFIVFIHECTYKYTVADRKIRYTWLLGKEKVIDFSDIEDITIEKGDNFDYGVIYKKGVKKPFMKINLTDKNADKIRYWQMTRKIDNIINKMDNTIDKLD